MRIEWGALFQVTNTKNGYQSRVNFFLVPAFLIFAFAQSPAPGSQATGNQPATQAPAQIAALLVVIDAAHGGSDSGAALNAAMPEKDVTLVFARRLRQELASRGIAARLLRDADVTLTADQRAEAVNGLHPSLYLLVHATSLGSGLRVYTALLPEGSGDHGRFLDWQRAQAAAIGRSHAIQEQVTRTLQASSAQQTRSLSAPLRPLNNVTVPAVAVEIAPSGDVSQLASSDYQHTVCSAMANAIASAAPMLTAPGNLQQ